MKKNLIKPLGFACVVGMLTTAYAFAPAKPTEPVYVIAPFKIESIDIKNNTAAVETLDEKYTLEVEYVAEVYQDGNGVGHNWTDVEVKEIKDIIEQELRARV